MVSREGAQPADAEAAWHDLIIILAAMEREPSKSFALTRDADKALHGFALDTAALVRFSAAAFGAGTIITHDPWAWGTDDYAVAWANTRAAFIEHGIVLPENYQSCRPGDRKGAEMCVMNVGKMAEMCVINVQQIADLQMAA